MRHRERLLGNLQGGAMSATGSVGKQTIRVDRRVFLNMLNNERVATPHKAMSKPVNPSRFINNFILEHIMHILNIGLVTSLDRFKGADLPQGASLIAERVLEAIAGFGFEVLWHKVAQSDTEPTLIVGVHAHGMTMGDIIKINKLSNLLQQDCIAAFDALNGKGYLIGDYAEDWGGEFNPEYFILG